MEDAVPGPGAARPRVVALDDVDPIAVAGVTWRPIRRTLDVTAFGINAYTADAGGHVVETHVEREDEELYVVLRGAARFTVDGEDLIDARAGTFVLVPLGLRREAVALEDGSAVLAIGGRPGAALPVSAFEHYFAAEPAYQEGDYARAIEIASAGLEDWPEHGLLNYQLACYHALAGDPPRAMEHLRVAARNDARVADFAAGDSDLDSLRDHPDFPR